MEYEGLKEADQKIIDRLYSSGDSPVRKTTAELNAEIDDFTKGWLSQRLNHLKDEGFLMVEKEGREKFYSLSDTHRELLQLVTVKNRDIEFIEETQVKEINANLFSFTKDDKVDLLTETEYSKPSKINFYDRIGGESKDLLDRQVETRELQENPTVKDVFELVAEEVFPTREDVREKVAREFESLATKHFESDKESKKVVLDAKEEMLDAFVYDTIFREEGVELIVDPHEELTFLGESLSDLYTKVRGKRAFPRIDSENTEQFFKELEDEIRGSKQMQIVLGNFID